MSKKKVPKINNEIEQLVTILRKPSGLVAVINRKRYKFTTSIWDPRENNSLEELNDFYEIVERPLEETPATLVRRKNKLLDCWNQLFNVRSFNAHTLYCIFRVLIETQNHPDDTTTYFSARISEMLCDARTRNELLFELNYLWSDASEILRKSGYHSDKLQVIYFGKPGCFDPYYVHHFPDVKTSPKLPDKFRILILPLLKKHSWKIVEIWLGLYRSLELDRRLNLLHSVTRMLCLAEESLVREWCNSILGCPQNKRAIFATLINETRCIEKNPKILPEDAFVTFFSLTTNKQLVHRLHYFLTAIQENVSIDYLFAGFRLANRYSRNAHFNTFEDCKDFPYETVVDLTDFIRTRFPRNGDLSLSLWDQCGQIPGFNHLIRKRVWKQIGVNAAFRLLRLWSDNFFIQKTETKRKVTQIMSDLLELLRDRVPKDYRVKFCNSLEQLRWNWPTTDNFVKNIPHCAEVLLRFCVPPFDKGNLNPDALYIFLVYFPIYGNAFLAAPQSSFLTFEKECSSNNDARLIHRGIRVLMRNAKLFTVKSFQHFPRKLFQVCKILGTYRYAARVQIVKNFLKTPIMKQRFRKLSLHQSADFIRGAIKTGISNPIPKALTKFLSGEYYLTDARKRRYRRIMFENLNLTRLESLETFIWETANRNYALPLHDDNVKHALQLIQLIHKNRRQLKRYLHFYLKGNKNYVYDHPLTKQWIAAHPISSTDTWQKGIRFTKTHPELGKIQISVEDDPFEILRMGTYVGSCLGLGGINAFSAAAVMLDFNKRVLYARNNQRKVIARQLIAISEQNQLVCFSVYPIKVNATIKTFFRKYDRKLAEKLNVPLCSDDDYDIKNILSEDWYDDNAWNMKD